MPSSPVIKVVEHVRKTVLRRHEDTWSDGQLLDCFIEKRDEVAFAALVRRHGPMVWGVCQRIVDQAADAEDAFQATFLVLVRKAATIKPRAAVGNWLYGVACRSARKARTISNKRQAKEKQVTCLPELAQDLRMDHEGLQVLLDQVLSGLPDKYRLPVVLCHLEGRTRKEVAAQLKIPEGTLSSRLATAHQLLVKRAARHGLAVSGASVAALLTQSAVSASMPASLISSTIKTATLVTAGQGAVTGVVSAKVAALARGVLTAMLLTKLKIATGMLLAILLLGAGAATFTLAVAGGQQPETSKPNHSSTKESSLFLQPQEGKPNVDKDLLLGTWKIVSAESNGKGVVDEPREGDTAVITADTISMSCKSGGNLVLSFRLDPSQKPKVIDLTPLKPDPSAGDILKGIYELKGDQLKICFSRNIAPGAARPSDFSADERNGSGSRLYVLERGPAAKAQEKMKQAENDKEKLQGNWAAVAMEHDGKSLLADEVKKLDLLLTIKDDAFTLKTLDAEHFPHGMFIIDPSKSPKFINLKIVLPFSPAQQTATVLGIYELDGDTLKLLKSRRNQERPAQFKTTPQSGLEFIVFRRVQQRPPNSKDQTDASDLQKPIDPKILTKNE